ncbi:MAG TPA: glycosyltransferase family 4 protein [Planctomycetota bacterium]|nr:glycosyltransferase family 4 protein [Planctomycetota bacterium]
MSSVLSRLNLVVNIRFPGPRAHGIQVAAMAEALAGTGLNVDVVVPRRFPYRDVDAWAHYGVRHTFGVQRLASLDTIDLFPPRWQRVPFLVQSATFAWRALARTAVERDAGILVRDHYTLAVLMGGLRRADQARVAAEVHNLPAPGPRRDQAVALLRRVPAVIAISDALADDLVAAGLERSSVLVARDGVHLSRFHGMPDAPTARRHLHLPEQPTVVYAGQFYPWKGVDTLIEAMAHLPGAQLLVVGGDAQNLPRVVGLAQRIAPGRVHFAGTVPHAAVPFHLSGGDVVVLPNSGKQEISARFTSPLKLFEAMASRRPIVASDIPSLREVLRHDRDALLVAPDDPAALAAGIGALLEDAQRGRRLAAAAAAEVSQYDWSVRGRSVAAFLRQRLTVRTAR